METRNDLFCAVYVVLGTKDGGQGAKLHCGQIAGHHGHHIHQAATTSQPDEKTTIITVVWDNDNDRKSP